jgi:hypothetical protein
MEVAESARNVFGLLVRHAEHEDTFVQPAIERVLPRYAPMITHDHEALEGRMAEIEQGAFAVVDVSRGEARDALHSVYLDLAAFTSGYLAHQDFEEREIGPALNDAISVEDLLATHIEIVSSIPPAVMAEFLVVMIPAMNIDDRTEMLSGMQATAPEEAFAGVYALAGSVLSAPDHAALGARLGLS